MGASSNSAPQQSQHRCVVIDDDDLFRESLRHNLQDSGFAVIDFDNGADALACLRSNPDIDIVLLDWQMPRMSGIEVLRALREEGVATPVILLTVLSDQIYEEAALAGGAIDFVEKSRSFSILRRRIELILERSKMVSSQHAAYDAQDSLLSGNLGLELEGHRASWKGHEVDLSLTEFRLVHALAARAGQDLPYRELYDLVHGEGFVAGYGADGYRANVRAFIKRIREKFRAIDDQFDQIENYPGFGYRWRADDPSPG